MTRAVEVEQQKGSSKGKTGKRHIDIAVLGVRGAMRDMAGAQKGQTGERRC